MFRGGAANVNGPAGLQSTIGYFLISKWAARATPTATAPRTATSTAAAAQSLTVRILGWTSGCRWSARCSTAVLRSSAVNTLELASSTSPHHTGSGRSTNITATTPTKTPTWSLMLFSARKACASPARAKRRRRQKSRNKNKETKEVLQQNADENNHANVVV